MSQQIESRIVLDALQMAIDVGDCPVLLLSDRGPQ